MTSREMLGSSGNVKGKVCSHPAIGSETNKDPVSLAGVDAEL